jgi:hypothetical protein
MAASAAAAKEQAQFSSLPNNTTAPILKTSPTQSPKLQSLAMELSPRSESPQQAPAEKKETPKAQVHISFISKQIDFLVTEDYLTNMLSYFGPVSRVILKKTNIDRVSSLDIPIFHM